MDKSLAFKSLVSREFGGDEWLVAYKTDNTKFGSRISTRLSGCQTLRVWGSDRRIHSGGWAHKAWWRFWLPKLGNPTWVAKPSGWNQVESTHIGRPLHRRVCCASIVFPGLPQRFVDGRMFRFFFRFSSQRVTREMVCEQDFRPKLLIDGARVAKSLYHSVSAWWSVKLNFSLHRLASTVFRTQNSDPKTGECSTSEKANSSQYFNALKRSIWEGRSELRCLNFKV